MDGIKLDGEIMCKVVFTLPHSVLDLYSVSYSHVMLYSTVLYTLGVGYLHWRVGPNPPWTQWLGTLSIFARKPPHQWLS